MTRDPKTEMKVQDYSMAGEDMVGSGSNIHARDSALNNPHGTIIIRVN